MELYIYSDGYTARFYWNPTPCPFDFFGGRFFTLFFFIGAAIGTCQEIHGSHLGGHYLDHEVKTTVPSI